MLIPINIHIDNASLGTDVCDRIVASPTPCVSWGGYTDVKGNFQTAYRIIFKDKENILWDSGLVKSAVSRAQYTGLPIPAGRRIDVILQIAGNDGILCPGISQYFYVGTPGKLPEAKWICSSEDKESIPVYFQKSFFAQKQIESAVLYVSAAGYCSTFLNGQRITEARLNPSLTDYTKTCSYFVVPEVQRFLTQGENKIDITLSDGWRRNWGDYLKIYNNAPVFFGKPCIWASLEITYTDKSKDLIITDDSWKWGRGKVTFSHLFDGETYDANILENPGNPVEIFDGNLGELKLTTLPGVREHKVFKAVDIHSAEEGKYIVDFGTNMSGVLKLRIPCLKKGEKITIRHGQVLNPDGSLNTATLRGAKSEDTYISSGNDADCFWMPEFTYHGFRYAEIAGYPLLSQEDVVAVMLCTDPESRLRFNSGSSVANSIHNMLVQTERSTTHGACNDTCGRSERMHWLDDGVNRYPEIAYNFEISKLYPHLLGLIRDTQNEDGSITCTAPHIYGKRPGDPLSSSYLMLAEELYQRCGNKGILEEYYPSFCAWEECLLNNSTDCIINYSYYGDWAGPAYSRDKTTMGGGAGSAMIPAIMVGTGLMLHTARLLKRFAHILDKPEDEAYYDDLQNNIKTAFLNKWYNSDTKTVYNGSQSCQALALWLDVLPCDDCMEAARIMRDDLVGNNYRFTTGAFCLRFMCDMLVKYGYVDEFYELMTREEYPSLGYMLQCGATTGWEKYEYLTDSSMNAHTHALQVSVFYLFYKYIGGIESVDENKGEVVIKPHYPKKLNSMQIVHTTLRGDVSVSWKRTQGVISLNVNVPFNTTAQVYTPNGIRTIGSGFYSFEWIE